METTLIEVEGLIGRYNHRISFAPEDDFVILHGPNGVGKTMLLELIKAAANLQPGKLMSIPFSRARIGYSDGTVLKLQRSTQELLMFEDPDELEEPRSRGMSGEFSITFTLMRERKIIAEWTAGNSDRSIKSYRTRQLEAFLPVRQVGPGVWRDLEEGDRISREELMDRYGDFLPAEFYGSKMPEALSEFRSETSVHLIETQRLVVIQRTRTQRSEGMQLNTKVAEFSQHLRETLGAALAENSRISQERDRTYPLRLLERSWEEPPSEEMIRERYASQSELRESLAQISLLDEKTEGISLPETMEPWQRRVMWTYLEDSQSFSSL